MNETGNSVRVSVCMTCGERHFPSLVMCPNCQSASIDYQPLDGRGRVESYTVIPGREQSEHITLAMIELADEGLRVLAQYDGEDVPVTIGMDVGVSARTLELGRGSVVAAACFPLHGRAGESRRGTH